VTGHSVVVTFDIYFQPALAGHDLREIHRKAKCRVKIEGNLSGEFGRLGLGEFFYLPLKQLYPAIQCLPERFFFCSDRFNDVILAVL